jgi:hypothetical protein
LKRFLDQRLIAWAWLAATGLVMQSNAHQPNAPNKASLNVLFVGNSFTHSNDLPGLIRQLAEGARETKTLSHVQQTPGGYTLKKHWDKATVAQLIQSHRWDYVVLQEQSQALSFEHWQRLQEVHPYARQLNSLALKSQANVIVFMSWGYKAGDIDNRERDSFFDMQGRLADGSTQLAKDLSATVAPVGTAWRLAVSRNPKIGLWAEDGRHPSLRGSYLAACVFYKLFYKRSPVGNPFTAGLSPSDAYFLQDVASSVSEP